jgi:putative oxidoreductase
MTTMTAAVAAAILIGRLYIGLALMVHGTGKLFGWFSGYGVQGTGKAFESFGFRWGARFAVAAGLAETGGGLFTALGLFGPLGPALIMMVMFVAIFSVHAGKGFLNEKGGFELPGLFAASSLMVAYAGPGLYSLDGAFGLSWMTRPDLTSWAIAGAIVLAVLNLLARRRPVPAPAAR